MFSDGHLWHLDRECQIIRLSVTLWKHNVEARLGPKPFRFEQYWTSKGAWVGVIENA